MVEGEVRQGGSEGGEEQSGKEVVGDIKENKEAAKMVNDIEKRNLETRRKKVTNAFVGEIKMRRTKRRKRRRKRRKRRRSRRRTR